MRKEAQFLAKIKKGNPDDCWPWIGYCDPNGYGRWGRILAHRVMFELSNNIPYLALHPKRCVCHACDNPSCCNPRHLWVGTQGDNVADMDRKGRRVIPVVRRGEKSNKAKLTAEQALQIFLSSKSNSTLAKQFGVSTTAIFYIKRRRNWAHVTEGKYGETGIFRQDQRGGSQTC